MIDANNLSLYERCYGALLGLAYGDAIGFPALFHRTFQFPERRRDFLWQTNRDLARQRIIRLTLPFTHRLAPQTLEPAPADDTEYMVLTAQALLAAHDRPSAETFLDAWLNRLLPVANSVLTGFSERAAVENLQRGLRPPATGNDNPQHYDDSAAVRAVAIGLYCVGDAERAAELAELDAQITNAADGIWAARAMAVAVALLAAGYELPEALARARIEFPPDAWIARGDAIARTCLEEAESQEDLLLLLTTRLINTVYSYGNVAPETVPAAFAIVERCAGDLRAAVLLANGIPKAADSLPALVGTLCGAHRGAGQLTARWQQQLNVCRGICLPFVQGVRLDELAGALGAHS